MRFISAILALTALGLLASTSTASSETENVARLLEEAAAPTEQAAEADGEVKGDNDLEEEEEEGQFWVGFGQAFLLIFISEIGDRTFILVTIQAAKMKFWVLILLANVGMLTMHSLSTLIGGAVTLLIPKFWTKIIVVVLFLGMGLWQTIVGIMQCRADAIKQKKRAAGEEVEESSDEERKEIEELFQAREDEKRKAKEQKAANTTKSAEKKDVEKKEEVVANQVETGPADPTADKGAGEEADAIAAAAEKKDDDVLVSTLPEPNPETEVVVSLNTERKLVEDDEAVPADAKPKQDGQLAKEEPKKEEEPAKKKQPCCMNCKNEYLFFLALLMCAEWGDKSQIAAIALAGQYGLWSILLGGGAAHSSLIMIAYVLGKAVEKCCKEKVINILGGLFFIIFGLYELFFNLIFPGTLNIKFLGGEDVEEEAALRFLTSV